MTTLYIPLYGRQSGKNTTKKTFYCQPKNTPTNRTTHDRKDASLNCKTDQFEEKTLKPTVIKGSQRYLSFSYERVTNTRKCQLRCSWNRQTPRIPISRIYTGWPNENVDMPALSYNIVDRGGAFCFPTCSTSLQPSSSGANNL